MSFLNDNFVIVDPKLHIVSPMHFNEGEIWFSVYGFGWGYGAFAVDAETIGSEFGAANPSRAMCLTAAELGRRKLLDGASRRFEPRNGERLELSSSDFAGAGQSRAPKAERAVEAS